MKRVAIVTGAAKPDSIGFAVARGLIEEGCEVVVADLYTEGFALECEAIRRVRQRVVEGGHDVPVDDIRRRFARSIQHLLDDYAPLADRWALWDNSTPPATLLANSSTHGIIDLRKFFALK